MLGPIPIHVWGFLVSTGILAAVLLAVRGAKQKGLVVDKIWDASFGMIVAAFVGARLMHVFAYHWADYASSPIEIFKFWHGGLSATGGVIGAILFFGYFAYRHRLDFWVYADVFAYAFPLGYFIGRLGCFLVHDHPGTLSDFVLAVKYPGGARHDLGLYLSLSGGLMFLVMLLLKKFEPKSAGPVAGQPSGATPKSGWPEGTYTVAFFIWYGFTRLFLDFLRARDLPYVDTRYYGLTPAQYFGIILLITGFYYYYKIFYGAKSVKV